MAQLLKSAFSSEIAGIFNASCHAEPASGELDCLQALIDVKNLPEVKEFVVPATRLEKDERSSLESRLKGNEAFKNNDLPSALLHFNDSVRLAPASTDVALKELSLAFGNRALVLFKMGKCRDCVNDVARAVLAGYPEGKRGGLLVMREKCLAAIAAAKLSQDDRKTRESNRNGGSSCSRMIEKVFGTSRGDGASDRGEEAGMLTSWDFEYRFGFDGETLPKMVTNPDVEYWNMSSSVKLISNKSKGRHFVARRDIEPGEILIMEPPYTSVLHGGFWKTHCHHCMKRTDVIVPCQNCASVIFCSEECRNSAAASHTFECPVMENLNDLAIDGVRTDILRLVTKYPPALLVQMLPELQQLIIQHGKDGRELVAEIPDPPGSCHDARGPFSMLSHINRRVREDYFDEYAFSALYLFKVLESTSYFKSLEDLSLGGAAAGVSASGGDGDGEKSEAEGSIDAARVEEFKDVVLKLLFLGCMIRSANTFTVMEDGLGKDLWVSERIKIGAGMYPLSTFLNHSCDPNTTRDFVSGHMVVTACCPIRKGEEVTALYYRTFQDAEVGDRKEYLRVCYLFDCDCQPCRENWPVGVQMSRDNKNLLVCCPGCQKVECLGDPFCLVKCPCGYDFSDISKKLRRSWADMLKTFVAVERGEKEVALNAPFVMSRFLKTSDRLLGVRQPWVCYHLAKGLFCRTLKIVRGLVRERNALAEATALRDVC